MSMTKDYDYKNDPRLSEKWKFRFDFYEKNGLPAFWGQTPAWRNALKELTFGQKIKVMLNIFAYFFSVIYLLILGLWKKAILVLLLNFLIIVIAEFSGLDFIGYIVNVYTAWRANIWYYELKVKGIQSWSL
ncbi:DUF2628 domain-containing protein [Salmonella enterica]